jgi:hypothetical protein
MISVFFSFLHSCVSERHLKVRGFKTSPAFQTRDVEEARGIGQWISVVPGFSRVPHNVCGTGIPGSVFV